VFHLVRANQRETDWGEELWHDLKQLPLEELKQEAYEAAADVATPTSATEARRKYYELSETVKAYVFASANGVCEACKQPAPFRRDAIPRAAPYMPGIRWPAGLPGVCWRDMFNLPQAHTFWREWTRRELNSALQSHIAGLECSVIFAGAPADKSR
jgi:hypothetical protein